MSDVMTAPQAPTTKKEPQKEAPRVLKPNALVSTEFAFGTYSVVLPQGYTIDDALRPEFWVNNAYKLATTVYTNEPDKSGSIIELRTVDHAFYARLYVRAVQERGLIVALMEQPVYFGPKEIKARGYKERWNVGKRGYDIIRISDNEIVADASKIKTKEHVESWINETIKVH